MISHEIQLNSKLSFDSIAIAIFHRCRPKRRGCTLGDGLAKVLCFVSLSGSFFAGSDMTLLLTVWAMEFVGPSHESSSKRKQHYLGSIHN
jgi:hypothetical protein